MYCIQARVGILITPRFRYFLIKEHERQRYTDAQMILNNEIELARTHYNFLPKRTCVFLHKRESTRTYNLYTKIEFWRGVMFKFEC